MVSQQARDGSQKTLGAGAVNNFVKCVRIVQPLLRIPLGGLPDNPKDPSVACRTPDDIRDVTGHCDDVDRGIYHRQCVRRDSRSLEMRKSTCTADPQTSIYVAPEARHSRPGKLRLQRRMQKCVPSLAVIDNPEKTPALHSHPYGSCGIHRQRTHWTLEITPAFELDRREESFLKEKETRCFGADPKRAVLPFEQAEDAVGLQLADAHLRKHFELNAVKTHKPPICAEPEVSFGVLKDRVHTCLWKSVVDRPRIRKEGIAGRRISYLALTPEGEKKGYRGYEGECAKHEGNVDFPVDGHISEELGRKQSE